MTTNNTNLRLHPEKGVNPRMTVCRQCGASVGVVLLGIHDVEYTCPDCGSVHYGRPDKGKCASCGCLLATSWKRQKIAEHASLPIEICAECEKKNKEIEDEVQAGGVYWRCADCGSAGALKADCDLSRAVREKAGIAAPDPCGVEFTSENGCPVCGKD